MDAVKIVFIVALLCCLGFSGYAQVSITKVSDLDVCAQTAVTGTSPSCTGLGSMIIAETTPGDFAIGADGLTLSPPAGWQFCTGSTPTITGIGTDFTVAPAISYVAGNLNITFTIGTTAVLDSIVVSGIQIQPLTTTAVSGFIFAATETGVAGVTPVTTDFGDLAIGGDVDGMAFRLQQIGQSLRQFDFIVDQQQPDRRQGTRRVLLRRRFFGLRGLSNLLRSKRLSIRVPAIPDRGGQSVVGQGVL